MIPAHKQSIHLDTQYPKIKKSLTKGGNATFIIKVSGTLISFLLQVLLARILGAKDYGDYIYVITLINLLHIFGKVGFDRSSLRFIPSYLINREWSLAKGFLLQSNNITYASSISLSLLSLLTIWLFQDSIRSDLAVLLCLASLLLPLKSFSVIIYAKIQALKHIALSQFFHLIIQPLLLAIILMIFFFGINRSINANIAVIINITVTIVTTIIAFCCLRSFIPKELSHIEPHFNTYSWVRVSLVLSLVTGFNLIMQQTDILMIGALHNTTDSGIYTVAQRVANLLKFGSLAINAIATPLIAETYAANKMDQLQYLATLATRRISVFTILSCLPLFFWGDKVLSLFGSDFQSAYPVLIVLTFGQIANAFAGPVGVIMTMTNNQKYALYITISSAFLNVLLNYVLIKSYGIIGAAIATSITLAFWNITQAFMVWRRLGVNSTIFARSWIRGFFS